MEYFNCIFRIGYSIVFTFLRVHVIRCKASQPLNRVIGLWTIFLSTIENKQPQRRECWYKGNSQYLVKTQTHILEKRTRCVGISATNINNDNQCYFLCELIICINYCVYHLCINVWEMNLTRGKQEHERGIITQNYSFVVRHRVFQWQKVKKKYMIGETEVRNKIIKILSCACPGFLQHCYQSDLNWLLRGCLRTGQ